MSKIIPFEYGEKQIRVIHDEESGEPLWVAKDICNALGLTHMTNALDKLDVDEKLTVKILQSGQNRNMMVVNESGLYTLILRSNKPEAKTFKRWVTHEVLPSIRKAGSYSLQGIQPTFDLSPIYALMESQNRLLQNTLDSMAMMMADVKSEIRDIRANVGTRLINAEERKLIYDTVIRKGRELAQQHDIDSSVSTGAIFSRLKTRFGVAHYTEIPSDSVNHAIALIELTEISRSY